MDSDRLPKVLWHIIKQYMAYCKECYSYIDIAHKYLIQNSFTYDVGRDQFRIRCSSRHNMVVVYTRLRDTTIPYVDYKKYSCVMNIEHFICNIIHNQEFIYEHSPDSDENYIVTYEDHLRCVPMPPVPLTEVYTSHQEARGMLKHLLTLKKMNLI